MGIRLAILTLCLSTCSAQEGCACSTDGRSNGVQTNRPGCALPSGTSTQPECFVHNSADCPAAAGSLEYPGAATVPCSAEEALFFAAERDDVDAVVRFRELGVPMRISRAVPFGDVIPRVIPLAVFAGAHGSFQTVEDLMVNEDFSCGDRGSLLDQLCLLSDGPQCHPGDRKKQAIEDLIAFSFSSACTTVSSTSDPVQYA